jgi:hypothetical protein
MRKIKCKAEVRAGRKEGQWVGSMQQVTHNNRDGLYVLTGTYTRKNDVNRKMGALAKKLNWEIV